MVTASTTRPPARPPTSTPSAAGGGPKKGTRAWGPSSGGAGSGAPWRPGLAPTPSQSPAPAVSPAPSSGMNGAVPIANGAAGTVTAEQEKAMFNGMHERLVYLIMGLLGAPVVVTTRGGARFSGLLSSAATGAELCITLKRAVDLSRPAGTPPKPALVIFGKELVEVYAADIDLAERNSVQAPHGQSSFRTDAETTARAGGVVREKELQNWGGGGPAVSEEQNLEDLEDSLFPKNADPHKRAFDRPWDQFEANEKLFGMKTDFDEEIYTTKLDRSGKDFKEREKKAEALAREIQNGASSNPHVREERGVVDDSGMNEEDKYGAVIRKEGAYIPPGARKAAAAAAAAKSSSPQARPNGLPVPATCITPASPTTPTVSPASPPTNITTTTFADANPATTAAAAPNAMPPSVISSPPAPPSQVLARRDSQKQTISATASPIVANRGLPAPNMNATQPTVPPGPDGVTHAFRNFASNEKERLSARKRDMYQRDKDERLASFKQWSATFKLNVPVPEDLIPVLGGDKRAAPPTPSSSSVAVREVVVKPLDKSVRATPAALAPAASPPQPNHAAATEALRRAVAIAAIPPFKPKNQPAPSVTGSQTASPVPSASPTPAAKKEQPPRFAALPPIPPFKGNKTSATNTPEQAKEPANGGSKLNLKAAAFNPAAKSFTPIASGSGTSPRPAAAQAPAETNPFFSTKPVKRGSSSMHVKEDFTPFKTTNVPEPSTVGPQWNFTGRPYRALFNIPPPGHMPQISGQHPAMPGVPEGDELATAGMPLASGAIYHPHAGPQHPQPQQHQHPGMAGPPQPQFGISMAYYPGTPAGTPFRPGAVFPGNSHVPQHMQQVPVPVNGGGAGPPMGAGFAPAGYPMGQMGFSPAMSHAGHPGQPGPPPNGQGGPGGPPQAMYSPQMQHMSAPQGQPGMFPPQMFPNGPPGRPPMQPGMPGPGPSGGPGGPQMYSYQPHEPTRDVPPFRRPTANNARGGTPRRPRRGV